MTPLSQLSGIRFFSHSFPPDCSLSRLLPCPITVIMDPPWEAQYDLGYYRPGDNIPTDTYWLPLHGYGPPLRGSNY